MPVSTIARCGRRLRGRSGSPVSPGWGWGAATELYRPILSYDELGGLFEEGPSKLYDALAKLLGLDEIHDAEKRIAQRVKLMGSARKAANETVRALKARCAESDDERATEAARMLRSRTPDVDAVGRLATGTADGQGRIAQLRIVAGAATPDTEAVTAAAAAFRTAVARATGTTSEALTLADRQSSLIRAALGVYELTGDTTCPVCGEGALDAQWKAHAIEESARVEELLRDVRAREAAVQSARRELLSAFDAVCATGIPSGTALASAPEYENLVKQARERPAAESELADFVELTALAIAEAVDQLKAEAVADLAALEAEWAPLAGDLVKWVALEREARATDATVKSLTAAKKWVTANAAELRNRRLLPLAEQAREIWSQLRQESNVDLRRHHPGGHQHAAAACRWRRRWTASPPGRCR